MSPPLLFKQRLAGQRARGSASSRQLLWRRMAIGGLLAAVMLLLLWWWRPVFLLPGARPLIMRGGDPHLRALMRTISSSESNVMRFYHVLHGGETVHSLQVHPNRCERIGQGTNKGNCSTAAGRYQLLYNTWLELAQRYHPERAAAAGDPSRLSFAPVYQDQVVYAWLADSRVWNMDLADQLRRGRTQAVLRRLSGTWTSLGYGIESNSMSPELPRIYRTLLEQELEQASPPADAAPAGKKAERASHREVEQRDLQAPASSHEKARKA